MKVSVKQLKYLFEKYENTVEAKYLEKVPTPENAFMPNDKMVKEHIRILNKFKIEEVDILYTKAFYNYLSTEFPADFRKPLGALEFMEMDRILEKMDQTNRHSKRKRSLVMVGEIYAHSSKENKIVPVFRHDEDITYEKWNQVKRYVQKEKKIYYRTSEHAIIIFVDLTSQHDAGYVDKFKMNTDLISIMVSPKNSPANVMTKDFIPTEDIFSVTDPAELLDEYVDKGARLIIIGEKLNDAYKRALIQIKKYDRYVRMMVVPTLDKKNLEHFFKQVKLVYNSEKWMD